MREIVKEDLDKVRELLISATGNGQYESIERLGGLTNRTYKVTVEDGKVYVIRIPGEGTEKMINRADEKKSTELAGEIGIDARCLFFGDDGAKVTEYIHNAVTMSQETLKQDENIASMAEIFKRLHNCGKSTGVPFEVFDMAAEYENLINEYNVAMYEDYDSIKNQVMQIKQSTDKECDIVKVPCHNDALCENWVLGDGRMYLIDWEYAGMNDAMWDLADVSIEACFLKEHDEKFLTSYLGKELETKDWKHFYASKIYVDFLWTLWAKTRVPFDGQPMEDWANERYNRLKENMASYAKY
ncbi:MAG: phosphotransferase family protein [Bacteroides heparinolyticus]|nr:phosphotransferase family protein [Bacteroides heparinolyticus]